MKTQEIVTRADALIEDFVEAKKAAKFVDENLDFTYDTDYFSRFSSIYGIMVALSELIDHQVNIIRFDSTELNDMFSISAEMQRFMGNYYVWKAKIQLFDESRGNYVTLANQDIEIVESLISQMRTTLRASEWLTEQHKRRLFMRLEALQREIHKAKSDFDVALAGIAEVGAAIGEFGDKAQPFADFMERIVDMFSRNKETPVQLPAPPKKLPPPVK